MIARKKTNGEIRIFARPGKTQRAGGEFARRLLIVTGGKRLATLDDAGGHKLRRGEGGDIPDVDARVDIRDGGIACA